MSNPIWIVLEVETTYSEYDEHDDEPNTLETLAVDHFFTDEDEAESIAHLLNGMNAQGPPDLPYDPTGCNRIDNFVTRHYEARALTPCPEDLVL